MSTKIKDIQQAVQEELRIFEQKFKESMRSDAPLLNRITHYIVKRKGKQMRPLLVLLSARMLGHINESTYRAASFVEMIHTATLVHDDVVDESYMRRGFFSINALWKNKVAVLVGDYLLSRSLLLATDNEEYRLLQILNNAVRLMSEGELLQMEKSRKLNITEEEYLRVIYQKTASFISAACMAGAASVTEDETLIEKIGRIGKNMGMAFQIKDDLFDYGQSKIGKPLGIDIQEKKMTLPLIHALKQSDRKTQKKIKRLVRVHHKNPQKVSEVIDFVKSTDGIAYTEAKMKDYIRSAQEELKEIESSKYREAFADLITFVIQRKK